MTFRSASFLLMLCFLCLPADGRTDTRHITYEVSFERIEHHEASVTATFTGLPVDAPAELRVSRTSPGRYALHEFAKNVYDVVATDMNGHALVIERPNPYQWNVVGHTGTVRVTYMLYGDRADGTYTGLDRTHAHMNMPATFMWPRGYMDAPVSVRFHRPSEDWSIATQLFPTADPEEYTAPDLYYFLDSPTEIAPIAWYTWAVNEHGREIEYRIALHHAGTDQEGEAFARSVREIVDVQRHIFGESPEYDDGRYTFIVCYLPHVNGDGMEHRNSTIVTSTTALTADGLTNLGTMSHEFFHQWNVERIRPDDLEPFDFEGHNMTDLLWFAEGFTSYYTALSIHRAGLMSVADYASSLVGTVQTVLTAPGRNHRSATEMSQFATFSDQGSFLDPMNTANTFISYYTWGSGIGLGLDLLLRSEHGTSVDALMRAMWETHGRDEVTYTLDDVQHALARITGKPELARDFMDRYVRGREALPYADLLARAGFLLRPRAPGAWSVGGRLSADPDGIRVVSGPSEDSPLYVAGVADGDLITHVNGESASHPDYLAALMDGIQDQAEPIELTVTSRGVTFQTKVTPEPNDTIEIIPFEDAGLDLTPEAAALRAAWLWQDGRPELVRKR